MAIQRNLKNAKQAKAEATAESPRAVLDRMVRDGKATHRPAGDPSQPLPSFKLARPVPNFLRILKQAKGE